MIEKKNVFSVFLHLPTNLLHFILFQVLRVENAYLKPIFKQIKHTGPAVKCHRVSVGPWSPDGAVIPLLSARQVPRGPREANLSALPFPGDFSTKEVQEPQTSGSERRISSQVVPEAKNVTLLRVNSLSFQDLTVQGPCPPLFLYFSQTHSDHRDKENL